MTDLRVRGGRDVHGALVDLTIADGRFTESPLGTSTDLDATGLTVLPGLLDLQVNGAVGIDLTEEPERLWEVAAALPAYGVTAFLPTIITSPADARERALSVLGDGPPPGWIGALPLGWHFEGPMIAPGRKGAHNERWLTAPARDLVTGWSRPDGVAMVTLAPELTGALDVIEDLVARDVIVAIGHTEGTAADVGRAVAAGARAVTHVGNAMPPLSARSPGPFGVALAESRLVCGVIADGHHLDPITLRVLWHALGPDRFLTVTDATAALGIPDGSTRLGDQAVEVRDGAVRLADGTLAGSADAERLDRLFGAEGGVSFVQLYQRIIARPSGPVWFRSWAEEIEPIALVLRSWDPLLIPGLLQTENYARCVLSQEPRITSQEVEDRVGNRVRRRQVLERDDPPFLLNLIDASVLRRPVGDAGVVREQLDYLLEVAHHPTVSIQLVDPRCLLGLLGAFMIAELANGQSDAIHIDSPAEGQISADSSLVTTIWRRYEAIRRWAYPDHMSLKMIEDARQEWT